MMKKIAYLIILAILTMACDKIEKPYKIEYPTQLISVDTPDFQPIGNVLQKYVLEEYTGHLCKSCPEGHEIIRDLKTLMGDTLITIAIHAGHLAKPTTENTTCSMNFSTDYRTEAGNNYNSNFSVQTNPTAVINRTKIRDSYAFSRSQWKNILDTIERKSPTMALQIKSIFNQKQDTVFVFVKTTLLATNKKNIRLLVLLTENSIHSPQKTPNGDICNYEHNYVLRKNISPIWGTPINLNQNGDFDIQAYALTLSSTWKKENCNLIAMIIDADTENVYQVESTKLE